MTQPADVQPMDPTKKNSAVSGPVSDQETVILTNTGDDCIWNDQRFPEASVVRSEGVCYECSLGQWVVKE